MNLLISVKSIWIIKLTEMLMLSGGFTEYSQSVPSGTFLKPLKRL